MNWLWLLLLLIPAGVVLFLLLRRKKVEVIPEVKTVPLEIRRKRMEKRLWNLREAGRLEGEGGENAQG